MELITERRSPNFEAGPIKVEFVVLHYTAADLEETLNILCDPARRVSAHLVIDEQGRLHELVKCWNGTADKAWHAGRSRLLLNGQTWEEFNNFSIGIEIVNLNGNVFLYGERQYKAVSEALRHLQTLYPALKDPERIVGHEQIAGWRGKCDPGCQFDWGRLYAEVYPGAPVPERKPVMSTELKAELELLFSAFPGKERPFSKFCSRFNSLLERCLSGDK